MIYFHNNFLKFNLIMYIFEQILVFWFNILLFIEFQKFFTWKS
jgi:hypothetical protein